MPLENDFANNVETFLGQHAVRVNGSMDHPLQSGGTTIGTNLQARGWAPTLNTRGTPGEIGVSLAAPLFTARFNQTAAAQNADKFDFSRPQITIKLDPYMGAADLPVFLIPYMGKSARGVRLPAHGDGYPVAYAMTASQNGCTVEVSGTQAQPYASHTNVIDVEGGSEAERWIAREEKINLRLFRLQQLFDTEERLAGGDPNIATNVAQNRTQFGFFGQLPSSGAATHVNYNSLMTDAANLDPAHKSKSIKREDTFWGHYRYYCVPTPETVQNCRDRSQPPQALVVGRRDASGWVFYYQVWRDILFYVKRVPKIKGLKLGGDYIKNRSGNRTVFSVTVVLDYGELWPNHTHHQCDFGGGI
jgi:hypothetical protein